MPRSFNIRQSIAPGVTRPDVISDQGINNVFGKAAAVIIYWNCDTAATMTAALSTDDGVSSTGLVPTGSTVSQASTPGKIKVQEDFIGQFPIDAGSKLLMAVTNPTVGALEFNAQIVVN
jgi:hypothetical protein